MTLKNYRWQGGGPKYYRVFGHIYYDWEDMADWLNQCRLGDNHKRCPRLIPPAAPTEAAETREADTA